MAITEKQDIQITVDIPQRDGKVEKIFLQELNDSQYIPAIANIAKRVAISDTADLIFRLFAKAQNGDANLQALSERIPCLKAQYLSALQEFFDKPENAKYIQDYNTSDDKKQKQEIRKQATDKLIDYVSKNISSNDLHYNFSKFKYNTDNKALSLQDKFADATLKTCAKTLGLDTTDPFIIATYLIWKENALKRSEEKREAYWLLIKNSAGKIIGMTFISSKQLEDKRVNAKIIGHSGQILDPSVQGKGYASAIKSVMIDYMYDKMDPTIAKNSLFATTCDEFNENSQGLQKKSGAHLLQDKNGNAIIEAGKMHWYATQKDILNSDIIKQSIERGIKYEVSYVSDRPSYIKKIGNSEHLQVTNIKDINYDR